MSEEKTEETASESSAEKDIGAGNLPEATSLIGKADAVAKRMEEANKRAEELIARQEAILSRNLLSGRAEAGVNEKTPEQISEEEEDKRVAETLRRLRPT